jgi:hypothetical protein
LNIVEEGINFMLPNREAMRFLFILILFFVVSLNAQQGIKMKGNLPEFEVTERIRPDTVVSSSVWMIKDFAFSGEDIYVLTWEKRPEKCVLRRLNSAGKEIGNKVLNDNPLGFYTDVFKQVFLEFKNNTYGIQSTTYGFNLFDVNEELYCNSIRPTLAKTNSFFFGTTWHPERPEFAYIFGNKSSMDTLICIKDTHLNDLYYSEFRFLPFPTQCLIKRRCRETGESKYDLAAQISGFTQSIWWRKLYSPLIQMKDSIFVADHYVDSLFVFNADGEIVRSNPINFHKMNGYGKQVLYDEYTNTWYAKYFKNGITKLFPLNELGMINSEAIELNYRYIEQIKLYNGKAYYLYRPFESSQNTYLYSEVLPARLNFAINGN